MKKLVFNGCSFMAGDEIVWEQFHKERGKEFQSYHFPVQDDKSSRLEYVLDYRKKFNLPAIVSRKLECEWDDLSADGKSNTCIAVETISYLNGYSKEEKQKFHVIIGWTSISRILKYSPIQKIFLNLTSHHYSEHTNDPSKEALKEHIKTQILAADDQDFILDYVKNVMFLENYLISNNISYTFYRAIDDGLYDFKNIGSFDYCSPFVLKIEDCTDHTNWYKLDEHNDTPINGLGWNMIFVNKPERQISQTNGHPNLSVVTDFSTTLSEFVKKQNVL
jgi:hypothetical protein